ncbi:MAG: hypothetical protein KDA83_01925 [Planctomycetales bacterium]|nr:hypothetical protein [Planctomycetales bacterium]
MAETAKYWARLSFIRQASCWGLGLLMAVSSVARAQDSEIVTVAGMLPPDTLALVSVPDLPELVDRFQATDLGQLATDPETQPFFESLGGQLEDKWMGGFQRVLTIDDLKGVRSGELGYAMLSCNGRAASVLAVDVRGHEVEAAALLDRIAQNLVAQRASEDDPISRGNATVRRFKLQPRGGEIHRPRVQISLYRGWVVVSNDISNEMVAISTVLSGLDGAYANNSLAHDPAFQQVVDRLATGRGERAAPDLAWFFRPFALAEAIKADQPVPGKFFTNLAALEDTGFSIVEGVGGDICMDVPGFDIKFQTYFVVGDPSAFAAGLEGSAKMLTFRPEQLGEPIVISPRIASESATVVSGFWDLAAAFEGAEPFYNRKVEDGIFRRTIDDFRQTNGVDLVKLSQSLGPAYSMSTEVVPPYDADSEKLVLAVGVRDLAAVRQHLPGYLETDLYQPVELRVNGEPIEAWVRDEEEDEDPFPGLDVRPGVTRDTGEEPILDFKAIALLDDEVVFASDLEHLTRVLSRQTYVGDEPQLTQMIGQLSTEARSTPVMMEYVRPDRVYRLTYELMRKDELRTSHTFVERVLRMIDGVEKGAPPREQQVDASDLPEDFDAVIAPRLNPSGWVMTVEPNGWYVIGGITKNAP